MAPHHSRLFDRITRRLPIRARLIALAIPLLAATGCGTRATSSERAEASLGQASEALSAPPSGLSTAQLELKTLTNSCGPNQAQDFFEVTNSGTTPVKVSDITIKFWVNDASAANIVPRISTGGCLVNASGCFHSVTGVSVTATRFSPSCGPRASQQANWEITITNTDGTALPAGSKWSNLQTALALANFANFNPGTNTWYSACLPGQTYTADQHFGVYFQGDLVFASGIAAPSCRGPHGRQQLSGHLTPAITGAPLVGPAVPTDVIDISIALPERDPAGLQAEIRAVSDPTSPTYRHYLTPTQYAAKYGATTGDYQAVTQWAQTNGLTVTKSYSNRLLLALSGPVQAIERALFVNMNIRLRPDGTQFHAPDREPSIDLTPSVLYVANLADPTLMQPANGSSTHTGDPPPSGPNTFTSGDLRRAYAGCTTLDGSGQSVGLIAGNGISMADLSGYLASNGLTHVPDVKFVISGNGQKQCFPTNCKVGTPLAQCPPVPAACPGATGCATTGSPCPGGGDGGEQAMDLDMVLAMAPNLDRVVMFAGGQSESTLHDMVTYEPTIFQLSTSWGIGNTPPHQTALNQMALQGQSFFMASGDSGGVRDPRGAVDMQNVTLVGGVRLVMSGNGVSWAGETVDSRSQGWIADGNGGSSTPLPFYQVGVATGNGSSQLFRNAPDVSLVSSNVDFFGGGIPASGGGTSSAAPLWAGFMALVNQQAQANGLTTVGFANPALYAIARSPALYAQCFHDVTSGNNVRFNAGTGYDLTTGLGTPQCALIQQLASLLPNAPTAISAGGEFNCALRSGGAVSCWGDNTTGEIGDGTHVFRNAPVPVLGLTGMTSIETGFGHACAISSAGALKCWGRNDHGQLGDGTTTERSTPVSVPGLSNVVALAAGLSTTCALLGDGTVSCWGDNAAGELGDGTTTSRSVPGLVPGLNSVTAIGAGDGHFCVRRADGTVACWGSDVDGQLGDGAPIPPGVPHFRTTPATVPGITTATEISLGGRFTCALLADTTVSCWGENVEGQLGDLSTTSRSTPAPVHELSGVVALATGGFHACAALQDRILTCWGNNIFGQLGDGTTTGKTVPIAVPALGGVNLKAIAGGDSHTCALLPDGAAKCWGWNQFGQIGDNTFTTRLTPTAVAF